MRMVRYQFWIKSWDALRLAGRKPSVRLRKRERYVRAESGALLRGRGGRTSFRPRRCPIEHNAAAAQPANPDSRTDTGCKTAPTRQSPGQADAGGPKLPDRG